MRSSAPPSRRRTAARLGLGGGRGLRRATSQGGSTGACSSRTLPFRSRTRRTSIGSAKNPRAAIDAYAFTSSIGITSPVPSASVRFLGSSDEIPIRRAKPATASTPSASTSFTDTVFFDCASAVAEQHRSVERVPLEVARLPLLAGPRVAVEVGRVVHDRPGREAARLDRRAPHERLHRAARLAPRLVARLNCEVRKSYPPTSARTPRVTGSMATSAPCTFGVCSSASASGLPSRAARCGGSLAGQHAHEDDVAGARPPRDLRRRGGRGGRVPLARPLRRRRARARPWRCRDRPWRSARSRPSRGPRTSSPVSRRRERAIRATSFSSLLAGLDVLGVHRARDPTRTPVRRAAPARAARARAAAPPRAAAGRGGGAGRGTPGACRRRGARLERLLRVALQPRVHRDVDLQPLGLDRLGAVPLVEQAPDRIRVPRARADPLGRSRHDGPRRPRRPPAAR